MTAGPPVAVNGSAGRHAAIYDRYATSLYRQAVYALGDTALAEQALCEVIVAECARPPARSGGPAVTSQRLAVAIHRHCQELRPPPPADPRCPLTGRERDALGLVLFGRLNYRQVAAELGMPRTEVATLLLAAMRKLADVNSQ